MTRDQTLIFLVLGITLGMFVWNRLRYDVVAVCALMAAALLGLAPPDDLFSGFGHPAVITVAAVLVISRGLQNAGVVESLARLMARAGDRPLAQVASLTLLVAVCSGFMNNVGALALLMPVAVLMARRAGHSPSLLLMPLAFGSLLGGTMTLIGTPPNIIIASYRAGVTGKPFGMFDFMPVGGGVMLTGVAFIVLLGWRLTPSREKEGVSKELFRVSDYLAEVLVPEDGKYAGKTLHELLEDMREEAEFAVVSRFHGEKRQLSPSTYQVLRPGDVLLVSASPESLRTLLEKGGLEMKDAHPGTEAGKEEKDKGKKEEGEKKSTPGGLELTEVIITHQSPLLGKSAEILDLRERHGVNVLGVARQGHRLRQRIGNIRFQVGDILLVQAGEETLRSALSSLGCLPLASRGLRLSKPRGILFSLLVFGGAITLTALGLLPAATALVLAALVLVLAGVLTPREACNSVDLSVIVLLAAMIPVGLALESTGGASLIAGQLARLTVHAPSAVRLGVLLLVTSLLSNVVNNAAAAILVAPVAVDLARALEASPDRYLMAVAVGASCAFLTPIGHQSNTLVMEPGGYRFGDYWRMGLPLTAVVTLTAVPLIMWVF